MPDPDLICSVDADTGEALLPLTEFTPLVERNAKLEALLRQSRECLTELLDWIPRLLHDGEFVATQRGREKLERADAVLLALETARATPR